MRRKRSCVFHKFGCFVTCFLDHFRTPEPPLVSVGALGDPVEHFGELFCHFGERFVRQGWPKRARRPPQRSRHRFFVDLGVQDGARNLSFVNFVCKSVFHFANLFVCEILKEFWVAFGTAGIQIISQIHGRVVQIRGFTEMEKSCVGSLFCMIVNVILEVI